MLGRERRSPTRRGTISRTRCCAPTSGVAVTDALLDDLKTRVKAKEITEPGALLDALQADMTERLAGADRTLHFDAGRPGVPNVWLFVGVNGVGKTTTIGKVAQSADAPSAARC